MNCYRCDQPLRPQDPQDEYAGTGHHVPTCPITKLEYSAWKKGVNDLSKAITDLLPKVSAWDGQEARDNSLVLKILRDAIASLEKDKT